MKSKPFPSALLGLLTTAMPLAAAVSNSVPTPTSPVRQPAAPASTTNEPEFYPWSETSEFVRVPRSLFRHRALPVELVPLEAIEALRMTPGEVKRINDAMSDTAHQYRVLEGKNLAPQDLPGPQGRGSIGQQRWIEKFTFILAPFADEALALRRGLETEVSATLGVERAGRFWQQPLVYMETRVSMFPVVAPRSSSGSWIPTLTTFARQIPPGVTTAQTFFSFELRDTNSGRGIFLLRSEINVDVVMGSGETEFNPTLDQYAPEAMQPVLARWRKTLADRAGGVPLFSDVLGPNNPPAASGTRGQGVGGQTQAPTPGAAGGNLAVAFVDLPRKMVLSLGFPGITPIDDVASTAAAIYGLTEADRKAVRDLNAAMRMRFEQLERANLERREPTTTNMRSFTLRAFPQATEALQSEWVEKLKGLVGTNRGTMLAESMRKSPPDIPPLDSGQMILPRPSIGPDWLHRGTSASSFSFGDVVRDGTPVWRISYQDGRLSKITFIPRGEIPERWRHLITAGFDLIPPAPNP